MPPERVFKVIDGGAGGGNVSATYVAASAEDEAGAGGSGGGGGVTSIFKLDVHRDVQWMKVGWAFLIPALAYLLFYFIGEMKDVRKDIAGVDKAVGMQTEKIDGMGKTLDRIEAKLDAPSPAPEPVKEPHN
jgi:hypothetical protein